MKSVQKFQVSVEYRLSDEQDSLPRGDKRVEMLDRWLDEVDKGGATGTPRSWTAKACVEASPSVPSMDQAVVYASKRIDHYVKTLAFPAHVVISRSVIDANHFVSELEVYGSREVAELLGISRQRLTQLRAEGRLPEPDAQLAATPVWKKSTVDGFVWGWRRLPGPAPKTPVEEFDMSRMLAGN